MVKGFAGGESGVAVVEEGQADEVIAGDGKSSFVAGSDADDASLAAQAGGYVEVALYVEGDALSAAEALIKDGRVAVAIDGVNGLIGRRGGAGDKESADIVEGEMQ